MEVYSSEENISSQSIDEDSVLGGSKKSESNFWGPIGFKKSNHPLSIMVSICGVMVCIHIYIRRCPMPCDVCLYTGGE